MNITLRKINRVINSQRTTEGGGLKVRRLSPINEPIVRYGPFVMNTRQQIVDAVNDYQAGRLVK
jgi:redox-sensitive bicupin YhaK (pirin superfamily)